MRTAETHSKVTGWAPKPQKLNPKPLNPEPLTPKPLYPKTLNPKALSQRHAKALLISCGSNGFWL